MNCTTPKYAALYKRWLDRPGDLLHRGGFRRGMKVLDLCGGTGVVAVEAMRRGAAAATVFDLNPRVSQHLGIQTVAGDARKLKDHFSPGSFDFVVCRQAINYMRTHDALVDLLMGVRWVKAPGDPFVFNTFLKPRTHLKAYRLDGHFYVEAALTFGSVGDVFHLQAATGIGIDVSHFVWWPADSLVRLAQAVFGERRVSVAYTSRSVYVVCR